MEAISAALTRVKPFSVSTYVEEALTRADYYRDENGVVIARVPAASGFFAQGETFEEARANLRDVIEGNLLLALQVGLERDPDVSLSGEELLRADIPKKYTNTYCSSPLSCDLQLFILGSTVYLFV